MAYSYVRYTGNGSTTNYTFSFPTISTDHIKVRVNGTLVTNWSFLSASTIQFAAAPANAAVIEIRRETPKDSSIVNFTDGSVLLERDLDLLATWQLYVAQETEDDLEDTIRVDSLGRLDAQNRRIINVADPVAAQDAVTKNWLETTYTSELDAIALAAAASATASAGSATASANSASAAAASYDSFDDRYLGAKSVAPTTDNDGQALITGTIYWDTPSSQMFTWNGTSWRPTFLIGNTVRTVVTATAGQTVVSAPTYLVGSNTLQVFVNGVKVLLGADYTETTQNSITFASGLTTGDEVELIAQQAFTVDELRADLASAAAGKGSSLVNFAQSGTGAVATTVQAKLREVTVTLTDYGADPTGAVSCNAALAAAKTYLDSLTVTPDAAGPRVRGKLIVPPGTFLLTADAALPLEVECHGRFIGPHKLTLSNIKRANITGLSCPTLKLSGVWFSLFTDIFTDNLEIDGGGVGFGTFWNTFTRCQANVTIDLSNWSVNQNTFNGRGGFVTIGTSGDLLDGHANNTVDWDFTGGQCSNTSSLQQDSVLNMVYYEAGADITGPYHIWGFQGDANGPPKVNRRNHILGSYNVIEKNSADFLATGGNILPGGAWDFVDSNGKPPCLSSTGGVSIVADTTEPFSMGVKYGGVFTAAFTGFTITVPPCRTGKFSLVLSYQSTASFDTIEVNRGGGSISYGGASVVTVDSTNNWKLLRLSGTASTTGNTTVTLFAFGGTGGSKTIYIGGLYATQEKAAQYPAPQYIREAHGTVTQGYVAGSSVDISVTFPRAFANTPTVVTSIADNAGLGANYTKTLLTSVTITGFTIRVYFTPEWSGIVHWFARGLN